MSGEPISFLLDGRPVTVCVEPKSPALAALRDELGVRCTKAGCAPQGFCGCCTVLVEGKPRLTCTLPTRSLAGKSVTTLDGVPAEARALLAASFVSAGAAQCGYCTPGIVLSAWALLQLEASPEREAIQRALQLHTCRCTGYTAIYEAITRAAAVRSGESECPVARPEAADLVLGARPFVEDLVRPGMWFGAVVFAPSARGRITRLELGEHAGCVAIALRAVGDELRHAGELVAAFAAPELGVARAAAAATVIETEAIPDELEEEVARGRRVEGDPDAVFAVAANIVEREVVSAATDPVFLEPEAALVVPGADGLVVYSQGHDAAAEAAELSAALGERVVVRLVPSGGSYGGKEGILLQEAAARLAREAGRPVRLAVSHESGMRLHRRRPGARVRVRAARVGDRFAVDVAVRFEGGVDTLGADRMVAQALGALPYLVDARIDARVVRTNAAWTGPIRGVAAVVCVAVEAAIDALVEPEARFELRARLLDPAAAGLLGELRPAWMPGAGLAFARVDEAGGARVVLDVAAPEEVVVQCNVPDLGQGRDERLVAVLAEVTGLPAELFQIAWGQSEDVGPGVAGLAPVERAARRAGQALRAGGLRVGARYLGEDDPRGEPAWAGAVVRLEADAVREVTIAFSGDTAGARIAEGAAHMGLGVALSEQIITYDGLADGRFRVLGLLKARVSPPMVARPVGGQEHEVGEVVGLVVPAAVACAIGLGDLPMRSSAAARAAGVRIREERS